MDNTCQAGVLIAANKILKSVASKDQIIYTAESDQCLPEFNAQDLFFGKYVCFSHKRNEFKGPALKNVVRRFHVRNNVRYQDAYPFLRPLAG
ncbi:MAG: hypothetical protein BBJ60_01425 [Desulfobacterales bacterium S7086C20]|nr:MAG: hypothetical protein BBJ60_01425 [Desulfobacterales bacterium S7086C20]